MCWLGGFGFCCSGLFLTGGYADASVLFWCFDVLVGVAGCCVFGSLLIFVFAVCGWVWCLMLVVVWLGGLLRFIAFGVSMRCSGLLPCCVLLDGFVV